MIREAMRVHAEVAGTVQGVGFRPFVYRLAREMGLSGWVANSGGGVAVEIEGAPSELDAFLARLSRDAPPPARVDRVTSRAVGGAVGAPAGFAIRASRDEGAPSAGLLPDLATCPACLAEVFDPRDRRYHYPFTNCTRCGPRYTIVEALPYDRERTTMRAFTMCPRCRAEYEDPADRRFHAEPIACPECGPRLEWWSPSGRRLSSEHDALYAAAAAVRAGAIIAVKGLGGFHLVVDARDDAAVRRLRARKRRPSKPFAVMLPSIESLGGAFAVSSEERALLASPAAPIVLVRREPRPAPRRDAPIAESVAPGSPDIGLLLPYTPLHHLLLREVGFPVVATSGNLSDEPICTSESEAIARLSGLADGFLVHDRRIVRPVDDSVARVVFGAPAIIRLARGLAPASAPIGRAVVTTLATGGHQKSAVALAVGDRVHVTQQIGELGSERAIRAFRGSVEGLERLLATRPSRVAYDLHPDYASTRHAASLAIPATAVQHHHAHVAACLAEHRLEGPVLGVAWDGSGAGPDGTVWGGEFLVATRARFRRAAHLAPFRLPGGDRAAREPRRAALGVLFAMFGDDLDSWRGLPTWDAFRAPEREALLSMLRRGVGAPVTTSAGRLFDAAASIAGLAQRSTFEGEGGLALEAAAARDGRALGADPARSDGVLAAPASAGGPLIAEWRPAVGGLIADLRGGLPASAAAARFHAALAEIIVAVARAAGERRVVLTGGCFQNRVLLEQAALRLLAEGFVVLWPRRFPPGDGALALGQAVAAAASDAEG
jgi:hydrogenase maturation protein HypF